MTDRFTKALLLAIALGLWANVATEWLRPTAAHAQTSSYNEVMRELYGPATPKELAKIERAVTDIANGLCLNSKIC